MRLEKFERLKLCLSSYDVSFNYVQGKANIADFLSRFADPEYTIAALVPVPETVIREMNFAIDPSWWQEDETLMALTAARQERLETFAVGNLKFSTNEFFIDGDIITYLGKQLIPRRAGESLCMFLHHNNNPTKHQGSTCTLAYMRKRYF